MQLVLLKISQHLECHLYDKERVTVLELSLLELPRKLLLLLIVFLQLLLSFSGSSRTYLANCQLVHEFHSRQILIVFSFLWGTISKALEKSSITTMFICTICSPASYDFMKSLMVTSSWTLQNIQIWSHVKTSYFSTVFHYVFAKLCVLLSSLQRDDYRCVGLSIMGGTGYLYPLRMAICTC